MIYTPEELKEILDLDFIGNEKAFGPHRRNDDVVDSMCICFALDLDFINDVWNPFAELHDRSQTYYVAYVADHVTRVKDWLSQKEKQGYKRGEMDIMGYSIHY